MNNALHMLLCTQPSISITAILSPFLYPATDIFKLENEHLYIYAFHHSNIPLPYTQVSNMSTPKFVLPDLKVI